MRCAEKPPEERPGRRFYLILDNGDGTVDVILNPRVVPASTPEGATDYDIAGARIIRGVESFHGLEEDIRERYDAWCETADPINHERGIPQ